MRQIFITLVIGTFFATASWADDPCRMLENAPIRVSWHSEDQPRGSVRMQWARGGSIDLQTFRFLGEILSFEIVNAQFEPIFRVESLAKWRLEAQPFVDQMMKQFAKRKFRGGAGAYVDDGERLARLQATEDESIQRQVLLEEYLAQNQTTDFTDNLFFRINKHQIIAELDSQMRLVSLDLNETPPGLYALNIDIRNGDILESRKILIQLLPPSE